MNKGYKERKTLAQGSRDIVSTQGGFIGGMNLDAQRSEVGPTSVPYLENMIARRDGLEARPGVAFAGRAGTYGGSNYFVANAVAVFYSSNLGRIVVDTSGKVYRSSYNSSDVFAQKYTETTYTYGISALTGYTSGDQIRFRDFNDGILIFHEDNIWYMTNVDGTSSYIAPLQFDEGFTNNEAMKIGDDGDGGTYKYRFGLIYVRKNSTGTKILSKSKFYNRIGADFYHYEDNDPIGTIANGVWLAYDGAGADRTAINGVTAPSYYNYILDGAGSATGADTSLNYWTHVHIYRTKDIGEIGLANGNNPDRYYFLKQYDINDDSNYDATPTVAEYPELNYTDEQMQDNVAKNALSANATQFPDTLDAQVIPAGYIGEVTAGWIHSAVGQKVYHSPTGTEYLAGLYYPAFQIESVEDNVTGLRPASGKLIIFTANQTRSIETSSAVSDEGDIQLGIAVPVLQGSRFISRDLGVKAGDEPSLCTMTSGHFIGRFSDGSIRIFDGYQHGPDLASNISDIMGSSEIKYSSGVYNPAGEYIIWIDVDNNEDSWEKCIRFSLTEEEGSGPSFYSGDLFPSYARFMANGYGQFSFYIPEYKTICFWETGDSAGDVGAFIYLSKYDYTGQSSAPLKRMSVKDYWIESDGTTARSGDISVDVKFPEMTGRSESQYVSLKKFNIYTRPNPRSATYTYSVATQLATFANEANIDLDNIQFDAEIYIDGSASASAEITDFDISKGVSFKKDLIGKRVAIDFSSDSSGFYVVGNEFLMRSYDRTDQATVSEDTYITDIMSNLAYRQGVGAENMALARSAGNSATEVGTVTHSFDSTYGYKVLFSTGGQCTIPMNSGSTDDFTVMFFINKSQLTESWIVRFGTDLGIYNDASGNIYITDFGMSDADSVIDIGAGTIAHVAISITGPDTYSAYKNGVNVIDGASMPFTVDNSITDNNIILSDILVSGYTQSIYDVIVVNKALSAEAIAHYYDDIINRSGSVYLPR